MPIYEYKCDMCGNTFDYLQKMSDDPKTKCENCNRSTLRKVISSGGFKLKGTGWYETDFKHK